MSEKTDEILAWLQRQQPKLNDADQLADIIMGSLPSQKGRSLPEQQTGWSVFLRTVMSVAASFLILITLWQGAEAISSSLPRQQLDFEPCIARYENDYASLRNSNSIVDAVVRYESMKKAHPSFIKQLKGVYHEKN